MTYSLALLMIAATVSIVKAQGHNQLCYTPRGHIACDAESETCCCEDGCCPSKLATCCPNNICCPSVNPFCCPPGKCCPNSHPICCGDNCCLIGWSCCPGKRCCLLHPRNNGSMPHHGNNRTFVKAITGISISDNQQRNERSVVNQAVLNLGQCFNKEQLELNEGRERCKTGDDPPVIGVGFNLLKEGARERVEAVDTDYDRVLSGEDCLDDDQIDKLLEEDANTAIDCAKRFVGNWDDLHSGAQSAIADMAYNIECSKLMEFKRFKNALARLDYTKAAEEMRDSMWCKQGKTRCDRNIKCMCDDNMECITAAQE